MVDLLKHYPETPKAIDPDIKLQGLKNPIYLVIIGFATRGLYDYIKKLKKDVHCCLIIEPDMGTFHQTLRREYLVDLIQEKALDIVAGVPIENLGVELHKIFTRSDDLVGPRPSRCLQPEIIIDPFAYPQVDGKYPQIVTDIIRIVQDTTKGVFLSMGCAADSFCRWELFIRNAENIQNAYKIGSLFDKFEDIPAIVVGGGPSVEDFIVECKKNDLTSKAIIIACDAVLRRLLKEGIKPHIVTRCERKLTTIFNGVTREDTKDVFYMGYPWTPPEFFDLFDEKFMAFRDNGVCNWSGFKPGSVNGGVSAANAAMELASILGCKKIYFTGIDLCFIDDKSHVEGTDVEFDITKSKPKWTQVPGNTSAQVTTIPVWMRCLHEYEMGITKHPKSQYFNTSTKGARITGAPFTAWSDVSLAENKDVLSRIRANLEKHDESFKIAFNEQKKKAITYLENLDGFLKKLFSYLDDAMFIAKREEYKIAHQLKAYFEPVELFKNLEAVKENLANVYKEPVRQIDIFRKHYGDKDFANLMLDMCQLDFFHNENRCFALGNVYEIEHERMKAYIGLNTALFRLYELYAGRLMSLLERGPQVMTYEPLPETFEIDPGLEFEVGIDVDRFIADHMEKNWPKPEWSKKIDQMGESKIVIPGRK